MANENANKAIWIRLEPGIRCRKHPTRKHGVKQDVYYVLRFTVDGKVRQEALGWASEGVTLEKARIELSRLKEAKRTGEGARSLRERRELEAAKREAQKISDAAAKAAMISTSDFWEQTYWPSQAHKSSGSKVAENALWKKWIQPIIGSKPISSISVADLERITSNMTVALKSPASIKYAIAVISQLWNCAIKHEVVSGISPTKHISIPKKDNRRQRFLSTEESDKLLNILADRSRITYCISILALDCGLRFGEIASLCWEDCDFNNDRILIRDPKSRANRYAFMTKRVKRILIEQNSSTTGLIFYDKNGKKLDRISKTFRRIADEMFNEGVTDSRLKVCFHTLRHTYASRLVEGGVSLYEVKELLGHSDFAMTQRYSHLSPERLKKSIQILEQE